MTDFNLVLLQPSTVALAKTKANIAKKSSYCYSSRCFNSFLAGLGRNQIVLDQFNKADKALRAYCHNIYTVPMNNFSKSSTGWTDRSDVFGLESILSQNLLKNFVWQWQKRHLKFLLTNFLFSPRQFDEFFWRLQCSLRNKTRRNRFHRSFSTFFLLILVKSV